MNKKVSIIIPNKNQYELLSSCIDSIIENTHYSDYEIIIVENNSTDNNILQYYGTLEMAYGQKVLSFQEPFNFSKINNYASKYAEGEYLLFLNNDTKVINNRWLDEMVNCIEDELIGIVGATLLYDDDTIQHAGVKIATRAIAYHEYHRAPNTILNNKLVESRIVDAVTGACLLTKKSLFEEVGGFDENLPYAYNDVDYCLKIKNTGHEVMWTPDALLYHYESKTRGYEDTPEKKERLKNETEYMRSKWNI